MKKNNIVPCKYAGDANDEYCLNCKGEYTTDDNGAKIPCTECGGYEPVDIPEEKVTLATPAEKAESPVPNATLPAYVPTGITTSIKAESGLSVEIKGKWYKFMYSEERIVPETCNIELEKEALWNDVNGCVDKQLEEVLTLMQTK